MSRRSRNVGEPTGRYRVAYTTVMGRSWADFYSLAEARRFIREQLGGHADRLMREYESDNRWAADFRDVEC